MRRQPRGFIVSHWYYDGYSAYQGGINSKLNMIGLRSKDITISVLNFQLFIRMSGVCLDYLHISGIGSLCGRLTPPYNITVSKQDILTLTFRTIQLDTGRGVGFIMFYEGTYPYFEVNI